MNKYELYIMVVGGDDDDERVIYDGNSREELEQAILDAEDEVTCDIDKYFELITPYSSRSNHTFYNYDEFLKLGECARVNLSVKKILEGVDVRKACMESEDFDREDIDTIYDMINYNSVRGKSVKWDQIYQSEEQLISDMMKTVSDPKLPSYKVVRGYAYINSFKKVIDSGKSLSDAQMKQLKRLAVEIFKNVHPR